MDKSAKWIWTDKQSFPGQIASFVTEFEKFDGQAMLYLSCETDYIAYVNGQLAAFIQYPNYPNIKYIEEIDITDFCRDGLNSLEIVVRYEGRTTSTHIVSGAGLIFSVECGGETAVFSSSSILSGDCCGYVQGVTRKISTQLGNAVDMCSGGKTEYSYSREIEMNPEYRPRPVKKLQELPKKSGAEVPGLSRIYDLGREEVGYLFLKVNCRKAGTVTVSYSEHIDDGFVRSLIGDRDFSLNFDCSEGENYFENRFVRLGLRYLHVEGDCEIEDIGIVPVVYPLTEDVKSFEGLDKKIYDISVRTLRLCMHEHYEDCPWREQALYVLDSRNQMKCGYVAFKEHEFQKQNLLYMLNGQGNDGMLDLTFPTSRSKISIPGFSLMYPVAVCDYVEATGDTSILSETMPAIEKIYGFFVNLIDSSGLIANPDYWNFYEWVDGDTEGRAGEHDLILNCYFIYSISKYKKLCEIMCKNRVYDAENVKKAVVAHFWNEDRGLFRNWLEREECYCQMGNALAVLGGLGDERTLRGMAEDSDVVKASLSTACFVYDALLTDKEKYSQYILDDIRKNYGYMIENGATSFWENIVGYKAFDNAGSLCHGWSAIPVLYLDLLLK